ncbi:ATP-binding protein [Parvicella tangerina]|uniref:Orc1-like AAA ATPase domain-containing protein n=1 Tax=Parvicella tangerina TaxID=2829795 RepID=A0A916JPZ6_9FLAO|nr:AAA family ATPase [Parvicella tangerina]CAG5085075.1 hypothetical protein CRYO30217_02643 [Parvicella tangerina]
MKEYGSSYQSDGRVNYPHQLEAPKEVFGRDKELAIIQEALTTLISGKSVCLEVSGESGMGKTHLKQKVFSAQPGIHLFRFSFYTGSELRPYELLNDLFDRLLQFMRDMKSDHELSEWIGKMNPIVADLPNEVVHSIPFLTPDFHRSAKRGKASGVAPTTNKMLLESFYIDFAQEIFKEINRKFVLLIDNMSLYDRDTLELLYQIFSSVEAPVMIVLSGRSGEWQGLREELLQKNAENAKHAQFAIKLEQFTVNEVNGFIRFCLGNKVNRLDELTELTYQTAGGNPKSLIETLRKLIRENKLQYDPETEQWMWDIDKGWFTSKMSIVSLFLNKYEGLDESEKELLRFCACLGTNINAALITKLMRFNTSEANQLLERLMEKGFIDRDEVTTQYGNVSDGNYHFSSEDVAEGIRERIKGEACCKNHRTIANYLINRSATGISDRDVFEAAAHVNKSSSLPMTKDERRSYTHLNVLAAKKARLLTSFRTGYKYIKAGENFAQELNWSEDREVLAELYTEAYHLARLNNMDEASLGYMNNALQHFSKEALFEIRFVQMVLEIQLGKLSKGLSVGLEILEELGIKLPTKPGRISVLLEFLKTRNMLNKKTLEEVYELPQVSDSRLEKAFQVFFWLYRATQYLAPELNGVLALKQLQLMLKHGTNGEAWSGLMAYGVIIGAGMNDYETAFKYADLGGQLAEKYGNKSGKVLFGKAIYWPYKHALKDTLEWYDLARAKQYREGDYIGAAEATVNQSLTMMSLGGELDSVIEKANENYGFCEKVSATDFMSFQKMLIRNIQQLKKGVYNNTEMDRLVSNDTTQFVMTSSVDLILQLKLAYLKKDLMRALELIEDGKKLVNNLTGLYFKTEYDFYAALTYIMALQKRNGLISRIKLNKQLKKFNKWAVCAPDSYAHKNSLLMGLNHLNHNNYSQGIEELNKAKDLASDQGNLLVQAMALDGLSKCMEGRSEAQCLQDKEVSTSLYRKWGIDWK